MCVCCARKHHHTCSSAALDPGISKEYHGNVSRVKPGTTNNRMCLVCELLCASCRRTSTNFLCYQLATKIPKRCADYVNLKVQFMTVPASDEVFLVHTHERESCHPSAQQRFCLSCDGMIKAVRDVNRHLYDRAYLCVSARRLTEPAMSTTAPATFYCAPRAQFVVDIKKKNCGMDGIGRCALRSSGSSQS